MVLQALDFGATIQWKQVWFEVVNALKTNMLQTHLAGKPIWQAQLDDPIRYLLRSRSLIPPGKWDGLLQEKAMRWLCEASFL